MVINKATKTILLSFIVLFLFFSVIQTVKAEVINITDMAEFSVNAYDGFTDVTGRGVRFTYVGETGRNLYGFSYSYSPSYPPSRYYIMNGSAVYGGSATCADFSGATTLSTGVLSNQYGAGISAGNFHYLSTPLSLVNGTNYTICLDKTGVAWQGAYWNDLANFNFTAFPNSMAGTMVYINGFRGTSNFLTPSSLTYYFLEKNVNLVAKNNTVLNLTGKNVILYDNYDRANTFVGSLGNTLNPNSAYQSLNGGGTSYQVGIQGNTFRQEKLTSTGAYSARVKTNVNTSVNTFDTTKDIKVHFKVQPVYATQGMFNAIFGYSNYSYTIDNGAQSMGYIAINPGAKLSVQYRKSTNAWDYRDMFLFGDISSNVNYTIDATYASGFRYLKSLVINNKEYVNTQINKYAGQSTSLTNALNLTLASPEFWVAPTVVSYNTYWDDVAIWQEDAVIANASFTPTPLFVNYTTITGYCNVGGSPTQIDYIWYNNGTSISSGNITGVFSGNVQVNNLTTVLTTGNNYTFSCRASTISEASSFSNYTQTAINNVTLGLCRVLNITFAANDTFELIFNTSQIDFAKVNSNNIGFIQGNNCSQITSINNNVFAEWYKVDANSQTSEQIIGVRPNWSDTKILLLYNTTSPLTAKNASCNNVYSMVDDFNRADSGTVGTQTCGANAITWNEAGCIPASDCSISSNRMRGYYVNAAGGSWNLDTGQVSTMPYANSTSYMVYRLLTTTDRATSADSFNYIAASLFGTANYSQEGYGGNGQTTNSQIRVMGSGFGPTNYAESFYPPANTWFKREMWRTNQTIGGNIGSFTMTNRTTPFTTDASSRFTQIYWGQHYDGTGTNSPIITLNDDFRVFKGVPSIPQIGTEQTSLLIVQASGPPTVTTSLLPSVAYTNSILQGFCNAVGDSVNLTTSYQLRRNNVTILSNTSTNITPGVNYNLFNYTVNGTADYNANFSLYCNASNTFNSTGFITSQPDLTIHSLLTYNEGNFVDNSNYPFFPYVNQTVTLTGSITDSDVVNQCILQINATGNWYNYNTTTINANALSNYAVPYSYYANQSNSTNNMVKWRLQCNDTYGTTYISQEHSFLVSFINTNISVSNASFTPTLLYTNSSVNGYCAGTFGDTTNASLDYLFASVNGLCYQETANVATSCGGLATGGYSFTTETNSTGFLYINYTRPVTASSAIWEVKHGLRVVENITIPANCYKQDLLQLRIVSYDFNADGTGWTQPQCYDGTVWNNIGTNLSCGNSATSGTGGYSSNLYDGDWSTKAANQGAPGLLKWVRWDNADTCSDIYEEAIIWNTDGNACYQESQNVSNQQGADGTCQQVYNGNMSITPNNQFYMPGDGSTEAYVYVNYTKPIYAVGAQANYMIYNGVGYQNKSVVIPNTCYNYNPSSVLLRYASIYRSAGNAKGVRLDCFNGSWSTINNYNLTGIGGGYAYTYDTSVMYDGIWSNRGCANTGIDWACMDTCNNAQCIMEENINWDILTSVADSINSGQWLNLTGTDTNGWMSNVAQASILDIVTIDNMVYTIGRNGTGSNVGVFAVYNPQTNIWTNLGGIPSASWINNSNPSGVIAIDNNIYVGFAGGRFGKFNTLTQTWTDLSSSDVGGWADNFTITSFAQNNNLLYVTLTGFSNPTFFNRFGVYDINTNTLIDLTPADMLTWTNNNYVSGSIAYYNNLVYLPGGTKQLMYINLSSNTITYLNTTDPGNWVGTSSTFNLFLKGNKIYTAVSAKFGVYNITDGVWYELTNTDVGNWFGTSSAIQSFETDNKNLIYTGITYGVSNIATKLGVFNETDGLWYNLDSLYTGDWAAVQGRGVYSLSYINNKLYTGGVFGMLGQVNLFTRKYNPVSGTTYNVANFSLYPALYGDNVNMYCKASNQWTSTPFTTIQASSKVYGLITYNESGFIDNSNWPFYPHNGDTVTLTGYVSNPDTTNTCVLQMNDSGSWYDYNTSTLNLVNITNYNVTNGYTVPPVVSFGTGNDGSVIFTTTTKSYGNLVNGVDYTVSGNTLNLNLNRVYNFVNFTLGPGTNLTTTNTTGAAMYILVSQVANISGQVNLNGLVTNGSSITLNGEPYTYTPPTGGAGGDRYACGSGGGAQGLGFGGGGAGGGACGGGAGGTGGTPIGTGGIAPGGSGGISAGGAGSTISPALGGNGGGGAYGTAGSPGSNCGTTGAGHGGGGAGGTKGNNGATFVIKANSLSFTGAVNTSGANGGNGGNGGNGCGGPSQANPAIGGSGGGGGGGGNAGTIKMYYQTLITSTGTTTSNGGNGGNGGTGGLWQGPNGGALYNGGSPNGVVGVTGTTNTPIISVTLNPSGYIGWRLKCADSFATTTISQPHQFLVSFVNLSIAAVTNITPNVLYWDSSLQAYCKPIAGNSTNLTLSYYLQNDTTILSQGTFNATNGVNYNVANFSLNVNMVSNNISLYCNVSNAWNTTGFVSSQAPKHVFDLVEYNMSAFTDNSVTGLYPQIGDTVQLNGSVHGSDPIGTCYLQTNVTGSWINNQAIVINNVTTGGTDALIYQNLPYTYTVTNNSNANNSVVFWKVTCNDSFNVNYTSQIKNFTVVDITYPLIIIGPGSLNIGTNNRTVLSKDNYNLTYNITYFDYNLFATEVNVSCDTSGQIYYWSNTSILKTNYTATGQVYLGNISPLQKCHFLTAASDSHTKDEIPEYQYQTLDDGLSFTTEYGTYIQILSNEKKAQIKNIGATKETDRYTFDFEFNGNKNNRMFRILADKKIYYIPNSTYSGHFVVWDEEKFRGNWIDFETDDKNNLDYKVTKINDYEYEINLTHKHGGNLNKFKFKSIGGTTITNYTLDFYIGGNIYVRSNNTYDNSQIGSFDYLVITTDGVSNYTGHINGNGTIFNVSAGTYNMSFTNETFFTIPVVTTLSNTSANVTVTGFQNQYIFAFRNVKTLANITNVSFSVKNLATNYTKTGVTGANGTSVITLNNGTYNVSWNVSGYQSGSSLFSAGVVENRTVYFDMSFFATFMLYDERLSTTRGTNIPFNISSATSVSFLLFCPDSTQATLVNSSNFTAAITCDYTKFQFLLLYGTNSYYRTYILSPTEALSYPIYLIDATTTSYLFNSLVADDLLSKYVNPSIYVFKVIGPQTVQITADFVDIEQKIGAYLVENNEYIVEIHSDNLPTYVIGTYTADAAGTKNIRLYQVGAFDPNTPSETPYLGTVHVANVSGDTVIYANYQDDSNLTTSVSFKVYQNNNPTPVCQDTNTLTPNAIMITCNATSYFDNSTITYNFTAVRGGVPASTVGWLNEVNKIVLPIINDLGPNGQAYINWFLVIFISVVALMGTIQTANVTALVVVAVGAMFTMFGWLTLSTAVLAFAGMMAVISLFKEGEKAS